MEIEIVLLRTGSEIESSFDVLKILRPKIQHDKFLEQIRRQQAQGYAIAAIKVKNTIVSAAGFRISEFLAWGKVLYVDDLITHPDYRGNRFGEKLMDWMISHAIEHECSALHLDTGYTRHSAHKLYLKKGLKLNCHHLAMEFENNA